MGLVVVLVQAAVGLFFLVLFLLCCCKILPIWCGVESGIIEEESGRVSNTNRTNIPQNPPHLVASRATDPPSSQQQYINRDNRTVGAKRTQPPPDFGRPVNPILNKGVPSVLAGPELEKPSSAQGGYREGFTYSKHIPVPAEVCPNKKNPFHSCTAYCEERWTPQHHNGQDETLLGKKNLIQTNLFIIPVIMNFTFGSDRICPRI